MSKTRIYELAKELGLENNAVLDLCEQLSIEGKRSHSNSLSDDEADKIRRFVIRRAVSEKSTGTKELRREGELLTEQRVSGSVIRRRKKETEEEPAPRVGEIDLGNLQIERELPTLVPDLQAERNSRSAALQRADELFRKPEDRPEEISKTAEQPISSESVESQSDLPQEAAQEIATISDSDVEDLNALEPSFESAATDSELRSEEAEVEKSDDLESNQESEQGEELSVSEEGAEGSTEENTGEKDNEERIAELRERHDIRAPKVLGKIDLPAPPKAVPTRRAQAAATDGASGSQDEVVSGEPSTTGKPKAKKSRSKSGEAGNDLSDARKKTRKKQVLSKKELVDYDGERDGWKTKRDRRGKRKDGRSLSPEAAASRAVKKVVKVDGEISVGELAKQMGLKAAEVMAKLMQLGVMAHINQLIDFETVTIVAEEFGNSALNVSQDVENLIGVLVEADQPDLLKLRPPVVTVMGHVDHGKTSLLDAIRQTQVTTGEFGGITQHIGAYTVKVNTGGLVTFLDTPGHEAFTAMRSRGAKITDIVVLVVAADDGVMPQTIEAINHAKAANVPIIVVINKMDLENANPDRVLNQLAEYGLVPEDWGGDTIVCRVSAQTREGVDNLLESLHLQAEILELKANADRPAVGTVIESRVDKGRGAVMTVLVQNGTMRKGDPFVAGAVYGKVRALVADDGSPVDEAGPSIPVEVLGLSGPAISGDDFVVTRNESQARLIAEERAHRRRRKQLASAAKGGASHGPLTLERFATMVGESAEMKELPLIVKGDVQGSVEAVADALSELANEEVRVKVIHKGVGAVTENDVQLASASRAILVAFNIRPDTRAALLIDSEGVEVLYSRVIYDLVDSVESLLKGRMSPKFQEKTLGRLQVRQTFKVPRIGVVAGSYVTDGVVSRGAMVRLLRDGVIVHEGKMASLRRFKDDVKEVTSGYECGIGLEGYSDIKDGDVIEVYRVEEVQN